MELTHTEAQFAETIKSKDWSWVKKSKSFHYTAARFELAKARMFSDQRESHIMQARLHRGLARVARKEMQRRRDEIERDHV